MMHKITLGACLAALPLLAIEVVYTGNDPAVRFAAQDLRTCLKGAHGTIHFAEDATLPSQAWRIAGTNGVLTLYGRDGMAQVYAAYVFLEKYANCRWYAPDTSVIPDHTGWRLPDVTDHGRPAILDREFYVSYDYMDGTWRLRNRETNRARFGCGVSVGAPNACHTFAFYHARIKDKLTPEMMGVNAKGKPTGQFCPSHPRVRDLVAEQMKEFIRSDRVRLANKPRYTWPTVYELSQDDGDTGNECFCARCRPLFDAAGSWSGPNLAFVNAVAAQIKGDFPDVQVRTFAYSYTELPPTNTVRVADNVSVRYCRSFLFQPLTAATDNGRILKEWSRHVTHKHIWSYWCPCSGPLCPAVKIRSEIAEELAFCREQGVYGYFAQDAGALSRSFAMMQHWLFLKLAENPDLDIKALSDEYLNAYYGKAAPAIEKYLDYLESRERENYAQVDPAFLRKVNSGNLAMFEQRVYLDRAFFETANRLLDEAERLAADDVRAALHVGHERLVVDRTMRRLAVKLTQEGYAPDFVAAAKRTEATLPKLVASWSGYGTAKLRAERQAAAQREIVAAQRYPLPVPAELQGRTVIQWPAEAIEHNFYSANLIEDADAATGVAVLYPTQHQQFKPPFFAGAYDSLGRKGCEITLSAEQIPQDEKYHLYRLGKIRVLSPAYTYFNSWHYRTWLSTVGVTGEECEIWISAKFTGPAYVKGSTLPDGVRYDRLFYVLP